MTIFVEIMQLGVYYAGGNHADLYFVQCIMHMTISMVIMQVAVSIAAMYVTASSSNFVFLPLTDIHLL